MGDSALKVRLVELAQRTGRDLTLLFDRTDGELVTAEKANLVGAINEIALGGGVAGVTAFNGRSGAVSLLTGDVTGALTYTPTSLTGLTGVQTVAALKTGLALVKADVGLGSADNTADAAKNVLSATKLTTARNINGVAFDGTADITIPGGGGGYSVVTKIAGYTETITSGEIVIQADLAAGFTIVLPTAVGNTATITIKKMQAAGLITVDGSGAEQIDGAATAVLNNLHEAITLISTGSGWDII